MRVVIYQIPPLTLTVKQAEPNGPWTAIVSLGGITLWRKAGISTRIGADTLATQYMAKIFKTEPKNN